MNRSEFNKLEINDKIFFNCSAFDCIASGCVTALYTNTVYVEIKELIYDEQTRCYNGSMTLGVDINNAYKTKEEALAKRNLK